MEHTWDADASVYPQDYLKEKLSEEELELMFIYERRFQKLVAQILDFHFDEIKEFVEECLANLREDRKRLEKLTKGR